MKNLLLLPTATFFFSGGRTASAQVQPPAERNADIQGSSLLEARELVNAGKAEDSLPYLEQAREWNANDTEVNYVSGLAYIKGKQPAKARESFSRLFKLVPESASVRLITAQMMLRFQAEDLAEGERN